MVGFVVAVGEMIEVVEVNLLGVVEERQVGKGMAKVRAAVFV